MFFLTQLCFFLFVLCPFLNWLQWVDMETCIPHMTRPLADCMSSSLFRLIYLPQWVKPINSFCLSLSFPAECVIFLHFVWLNSLFSDLSDPLFNMFCDPRWWCVYTDVTPTQRVVVECWISLQGVTQTPQGIYLPPTKTEREGEEIIVVGRAGRDRESLCVGPNGEFFKRGMCSHSRAITFPSSTDMFPVFVSQWY